MLNINPIVVFHHLLESSFGITAHQFQHQMLMQKALNMHQKQAYSWTTIADRLGYPDVQTFSKVFKKTYSVAPSFYENRRITNDLY